jgi:hypothetical protein
MKRVSNFLILIGLSWTAGMAWSQDGGWPRVVNDGRNEIVVYQPQPDSLDGITLQSRVAVSIKRPEDNAPLFGALWVIATLDIDRDQDLARVVSVKIDRTRFADVADSDVQSLVQFLEADVPQWDLSISLTRLRASLQATDGGPNPDYRNDPPKVIVVNYPAILLLLDGEPRLQDAGAGGLQQVVNTALPVIFDPKSKQYWFFGSSVWFTTTNLLGGTWTPADKAPSNIGDLVQDKDTLEAAQADAGKAASAAQLRSAKIIVATEPAELIVTEGAPKYSPIVSGDLLYVTNTDSDIFMEVATQRHFIVLSGRWFAGPSIQGPWSFVAPDALPKVFAKIPENSPKANDLAFVPGTDRAKDAVMDNVIPQTAEVSRKDAKIEVQYDGAPQFSPIPNTSLAYAENTPAQVLRANGRYYACDEGVWYVAPAATGPWAVSDVRPVGVDDIPPSNPLYNTRFVYIYDSTPDVVYVGYLPGYRWSLPYRGVVFYGTGYRYRGWAGRYYYPRPTTWGFYVRYNAWAGWSFGMSWTPGWLGISSRWGSGWAGWGPAYGPGNRRGFWSGHNAGGWFGPGGYRPPRPPGWRPPLRPGVRPQPWFRGRPGNIYNRPGTPGIRPGPDRLPRRPETGPRPGQPHGRPGGDKNKPKPGPGVRPPAAPDKGRPVPTQPGRPDASKPGFGRPPATPDKGAPGPRPGQPQPGRPDTSKPGPGVTPPATPDKGGPGARPGQPQPGRPDASKPGRGVRPPAAPGNDGSEVRPGTRPGTPPGRGTPVTRPTTRLPKPEDAPAAARPTPTPARPAQQQPAGKNQKVRPAVQTEPRDGGSIEAERKARERGAAIAPQAVQQKKK